jgi:5S rRNA maturation endonuclease (ribonuclease M5)
MAKDEQPKTAGSGKDERAAEPDARGHPSAPVASQGWPFGISANTAQSFEAQLVGTGEDGSYSTRLPLRSATGVLIGHIVCSVGQAGAEECIHEAGVVLAEYVFNLQQAIATGREEVIVVEGVVDCMKVHDAGLKNVIALFGAAMSETQEQAIVEHFSKILLGFDGDDAGWKATQDCVQRLACQGFVKAAVLPSNAHPRQLSHREIVDTFANT